MVLDDGLLESCVFISKMMAVNEQFMLITPVYDVCSWVCPAPNNYICNFPETLSLVLPW